MSQQTEITQQCKLNPRGMMWRKVHFSHQQYNPNRKTYSINEFFDPNRKIQYKLNNPNLLGQSRLNNLENNQSIRSTVNKSELDKIKYIFIDIWQTPMGTLKGKVFNYFIHRLRYLKGRHPNYISKIYCKPMINT